MKYNFDKIINRSNTDSIKWDRADKLCDNKTVVPFSVADMDFESPQQIACGIIERAKHGVFGYATMLDTYFDPIIDWLKNRHDWQVNRDWVSAIPGVIPILNIAILAFTEPGDGILVQSPVYPPFFSIVNNNGRKLVNNQLKVHEGKYYIDFDLLEKQLSQGVKMMILCSPHNPVGRVWTLDELLTISSLCIKNNVLLVCDEIHADLTFSGVKHFPLGSISGEIANNSITCISPTKTFNIPGIGVSSAIIPNKRLRDEFKKTSQTMSLSGLHCIFGYLASETAYRYGAEWLDQLLEYLEGTANILDKYILENIPEIKYNKPEGTYLGWLNCRDIGIKDEELRNFFINEAGIELNDGTCFGAGGEGYLRFNFASPRSMVIDALDKMKTSIDKHLRK